MTLTIYSRPGCHLCDDMKAVVNRVVRAIGERASIDEVDISTDPALEALYGLEIPVLLIDALPSTSHTTCFTTAFMSSHRWQPGRE